MKNFWIFSSDKKVLAWPKMCGKIPFSSLLHNKIGHCYDVDPEVRHHKFIVAQGKKFKCKPNFIQIDFL